MSDEPARDFYVEAQMILKGLTGLLVERRHLEALDEHLEVTLIRIANKLEEMKNTVLEMP